MTIDEWLINSERSLSAAGIETARLDALVLLEYVTGRDRSWLLAHPEYKLSPAYEEELKKLLKRRATHEPLAYILGRCEFYGREFVLTPDVLQPRPESETMIELLKALHLFDRSSQKTSQNDALAGNVVRLADVGAGSGALGITTALELDNILVDLLEIDPKALAVAKINVDKFTLNVSVMHSDLLAGSSQNYDILLCNLPYVPDNFQLNPAAMREPRIAIFGGPDGLDVYRKLFNQVKNRAKKPLYILSEALPPQHGMMRSIARGAGYKEAQAEDFIQVFAKV